MRQRRAGSKGCTKKTVPTISNQSLMLLRSSRCQCRRVISMAYPHSIGEGGRVYLYINCCHLDFRPAGSGERHESLPLWIPAEAWEVDGQLADADPCWFLLFPVSQTMSCYLAPWDPSPKGKPFSPALSLQEGVQTKARIAHFIFITTPYINNNWNMSLFCGRCSYFY